MPKIPAHISRTDYDAIADWIESDDFEIDPSEWRDTTPIRRVAAAHAVVERANELLATEVHAARDAGMSWTLIAIALDVSRQAARQRFGTPAHA